MSTTDILDLVKKVKSEMPAGAFSPAEGKSLVYGQQQGGETVDPNSLTPEARDVLRLVGKIKQGSVAVESKAAGSSIDSQLSPKYDSREQAIIDRNLASFADDKLAGEAAGDIEVQQRRQQRAYAEQATPEVVAPVKELLSSSGDRAKVLGIVRKMTPEQKEETLRLAAGVAQQMGDDRGGAAGRTLGALSLGVSKGVSQPIMELVGMGGTQEEIDYIRKLDAIAAQEFAPARPGDPWYESGPLQAAQMAPWMATVVGGNVAGTAAGKIGGQLLARGAAAGVPGAKAAFQAAGAVGRAPTLLGRQAMTTRGVFEGAGGLAGITAASFPGQYAQEVDSLKELGMQDDWKLRLLAGGTATVGGLIEGIVPNPFGGTVSLKQGAMKAARQYLWEAIKKAPAELTEEGLQGFTSGLGEYVAQYIASEKDLDFGDGETVKSNGVKKKTIADAFKKGWEQTKEAALPMAFLLGVPAVGGAGLSAIRARRYQLEQIRAKNFVSESDAKEAGIEGTSRRERMDNLNGEMQDLDNQEKQITTQLDQEFINQQQQQAQAPQPQAGVQPEQMGAGSQVDEAGELVPQASQTDLDREFAERMAARGGNVSTPPPTSTPTTPPVVPQQTPASFAARMARGEQMTSPEDQQYRINNAAEIEAELQKLVQAPGTPALTPEQADQSDREFADRKAAEQVPQSGLTIDSIRQAASSQPIGKGGNASVYGISDDLVLRVPKGVKEIIDDFEPVDHPLTKLGVRAGQAAFENSQGVGVLQRQRGEEAGLSLPRLVPEGQGDAVYSSRVKKAAAMPQSAYDELASTMLQINNAGYLVDPSKSSNLLIDSEGQQFNFVDTVKADDKENVRNQQLEGARKNAASYLLVMLMGNTYAGLYKGDPLTGDYKQIYDKVMSAAASQGLETEMTSSGKYSMDLAGVKEPESQQPPVAPPLKNSWQMSRAEAQELGWGESWSSVIRRGIDQGKDVPVSVRDELFAYDKERESKSSKREEVPKAKVGDTVVRYTHKDGSGLLNNNGLDRSKLTDDEEAELVELMDFGLQQPASGTSGVFYFTKEGEQKHKRMIDLLSKASKKGVVRSETVLDQEPSWESEDGQIAVMPKQGRKPDDRPSGEQAQSSDVVSPESEIDAAMEEEFKRQLAQKSKDQQPPPSEGKPPKKRSPRKKKPSTEKPPQAIRSKEERKKEIGDLWNQLISESKNRLPSGLDPELLKIAAKLAIAVIEDGALTFAEFVKASVANIPGDMLDRLKPYIESAWRTAHRNKMTEDAGGKFDDYMKKPQQPKQEQPEAKKPEPKEQPEAEKESEVDKTLRQAGLNVEKLADGTWQITGNTYEHSKEIGDVKREVRELGGYWDKYGKKWTFKADPRRAIADRLVSKGVGTEPADDGVSAEQMARERARRAEDEKPDVQTTSESYVASVDQSTRDLIGRGLKFGMTEEVVSNQIEDVGRVVNAAENGRPMFVIGSAPGTGKTFVLGGVIRELRKRGFKKFVYVTQNQDLVSQVQNNLADYGLEGVEFVTYTKARTAPPSTSGAVLLLDEAHSAKNLDRETGKKLSSMVQSSDFTVYATATPFENVTEAEYIGYSGIFDDLKVQFDRPSNKPGGRPFRNELYGFKAWAWMFGANVYFVKQEDRNGETRFVPVVWWDKQQTSEEDQLAANEWLKKRGVYVQRPMALPVGMVNSELRSIEADPYWADISNQVVDIYADAESEAESNVERGQIKAHKANVLKRLLEASKVDAAIARAKDLIGKGETNDPQVIIFVNTKADTDIGTYTLSEPYRKEYGIKGKDAKRRYTPSEMDEMMQRWYEAKAIAKEMGDNAGPPPFAPFVHKIAMAMDAAGVMEKFPSVIDKIMDAFPGQAVEYSGRTASQNSDNLAKWKNNEAKLIVATMDKGGTGLSFHDTTGKMPSRYQVNMNLPWSGTKVEQVSGRLARYGTAKPVNIEWLFASNIPFDRELSKTVGSRMRSMAAAVQGRKSGEAKQIRDFDFEESPVVDDNVSVAPWSDATVEDEGRWAGTSVNVSAKGKEEGYAGKVVRVLNKGETIEVQRDGFDAAVRVPAERVSVVDLVDSKPESVQQSDKAAKILADMESNQEKMRQDKRQREGEKLANWVKAFEGSPREVTAAKDLFRKDFEKARENGVSDDRLIEIIEHGQANEMFTEREAADLKNRINPAKQRHELLLDRAAPYVEKGESYKRDIADPAMRLQTAIAKGNAIDSSLVQTLTDELEVILDYWEPLLGKLNVTQVINETWGNEQTLDKAVERQYQADRMPIIGKAMQEEKTWYQTQDESLDDKIQAWLDGGELPTRVYGNSSGVPMDLGNGAAARKRAQSLANKLGVGVAIVQHTKTFKAFFVELPVSSVEGKIYGSQVPLDFDKDFESVGAVAPDAGKEKKTNLDKINDELLGITTEKIKNDLIAKAAEDLGSEVQPKQSEVKDETRDQEDEERPDTGPMGQDRGAISGYGVKGKSTSVITADKSTRRATYYAVEADSLIPSHDARKNFAKNEGSLENERPYEDPKEGADSRQTVRGIAEVDKEKRYLLTSDTMSPTDGPPIVDLYGRVLGGNARSMGMQLAYAGPNADVLRSHMRAEGAKFEIPQEQLDALNNPVIIRVMEEPFDENTISSLLNESLAAAKSQATVVVSQSKRLSEETIDLVASILGAESEPSLREVMANPRQSTRIVQAIVRDGAWSDKDIAVYVDPGTGDLTAEGKLAIENMLVARVIPNVSLLGDVAPSVKQKILSAIGPLTKGLASEKFGKQMLDDLVAAIEAYNGYLAERKTNSLQSYFFEQKQMFPVPGHGSVTVAGIVHALADFTPTKFRNAMRDVVESLGIGERTPSLFGDDVTYDTIQDAVRNVINPPLRRDTDLLMQLDDRITDPPQSLFQSDPDIDATIRSKALDLGIAANEAGITAFDDFVRYSLERNGEKLTRYMGAYLAMVGKAVGMTGIRPVKDILGVPMTKEEYVQLGKEAFASVPAEQVEAGIEAAMLTGLPQMAAGFAPAGSPVPGQGLMQGDFDQPADYEFTESDYRPAVVSYARDKWGSAVAANGKPTWQNFVRWFDDSAVVDKDGKPLVVYHGTAKTFDEFFQKESTKSPSKLIGFFFSPSAKMASDHVARRSGGEPGSQVYPVYLSVKNPYVESVMDHMDMNVWSAAKIKKWKQSLIDEGYDGIYIEPSKSMPGYEDGVWIAFDPTQIKSATGNRGTFDPNNPNMLYQEGKQVDADTIPKAVLSKMSRRLKSMGYDSRGAEDVRKAIKEMRLLDFQEDWIAAYQFAIGSEQERQGKAAAKKDLKHVNWSRLSQLGETLNPNEAGYIKPDGSLADFSGKREGGQPGTRSFDHREAGGTAGMQEVIAYGWVRMDENSGSLDIAKMPTPAQLSAITRMAQRKFGEIVLDLEDGLGEWRETDGYYINPRRRWSQQYPEGTKPQRIINDIKKFFGGDTPNTLFQTQQQGGNVKGWTKFISGTRALIGATSKADISTVIHEYAHVIRRFLLNRDVPQDQRIDITDEEIAMLEEKCGVKDGNWDVPAEEKFAKMWEQYFFEGKSPNTLLDSLFEKISRWMQQVYQSAMSITGGTLDPEVRDLFDKMVQRQLPADQRTGARSRDGGKDKPPIYLPVTSDQWGDNLTSLANAAANATRERLKLPSLTEPASEGFQEWLDAAVVLMRNDPTYANRLVKELQQSSRSIDDVDVAVLNLHYRHLKNLSDAAANRLFKAIDDKQGDVAIVQARRESDALINEIEDFTDMTKKVGTEAGRALVARKIALAEDYTLGNLLLKARVANAGQPLSEAQLQEVRELADKIAKLEGDLAKEIQEKDDLARKLAAKESIDDTQKEVGKPVRNTATNRAVKKVENFVSKFVNIFGKRDDTTTLQQTEDEAMAEDGEEVIKSFVEAGVYSFGEFMSKFKAVIKGDVPVAARAALRKAWDKLKAQGDIPAPDMSDERQTAELRRLAKMVERNLVEFGITDPEEVIDGVHEALQEVFEDVTRREAMDAMSGYGQYSTPSQEPVDKIIRDLNAQYQQMAKKDDMQQGVAPKKSGRGRDEPSPELRELIREVNEMKRNSKYFITDPEAQLKTIFQATRTALRNRIYDLNKAIKAKEPIPGRTPNTFEGEQAKEIESLRKQRDELMADYKATFPKPGLTFEQRAAIAERAVDREITKIEQQLASGNVAAKERAEPVSTPALKDKQNRLESLRAQREAVREMQMTDADREQRAERLERQAEKAYVANLLNRIADYEDRKAQGYFGPKPKKEPRTLSPREVELSRQLVSLKDEFFRYAAEYRLRNMGKVERFWDRTKETMHLSRAIMTSFDLSAVFRQGGIASLAHPRLAAAASREMWNALWRGGAEFDTMDKISKDELYTLAMRAGLSITTDSGKITRQEEAYMGRWAKWGIGKKGTKINELSLKALFFVAPSARSYTTFLNSMRFRVFKYMVSNLGAGGEVTIDEAKVIASYVNAATGRAELGKFNQAAANLNTVFFAPRYVASRFQYLAMPFYLLPSTKVSGRVKKMIAMEYARHVMGLTAFLGLSVALASLLTDDEEEKPTVEFDPRSSDFMKLKIGDTRIDPMAGLSQTVTLIGQMATGQKKGLRGDIKDLYGENRKFGDPDLWDVGTGFLRKKLAPIPGAIVDLRVGENVIGEKETVLSATTDLFVPLSFQEAGETMKARGLVGGAVVTALSLLGMGGGTYGPKTQYATADAAKREELFNKDLDRVKWNDPDLAYKDFLTTAQVDKFNKQREGRKQSLVFSAAADPKRKDYNSDETFKKSVEDRDKALDAIVKAGMGSKEIQLLLIAYYKRNYGSAYETREGVYQMKESLASRLQTIRRKLNEKKTPAK